jgi:RND family efflux transporter MFP subunit
MKKKRTWLIIAIIILLIAGCVILIPKTATTQNNYAIEKVTKGDINLFVSASGNIAPENTYNITPRTNAKILEVNVKNGDKVTKGKQLARLDDTDLQSAVKAAQYSFNAAVYARDKLKNMPIVDDYSVKQAQQQINSTSVQLDTAKRNLNNAKIESPIDGTLLAVNIKVDEYANIASPTPAFVVGNIQNLFAFLTVNEIDISKVKVGQTVDLTVDALTKTIAGKIIQIDDSGTNITGIIYYKIKVSIPDQAGLKPNMTTNGEINVDSKIAVLMLPSSAISQRLNKSYVKLAKYDDKGVLTPQEIEVQTGINNNTTVEIVSGVNEGDEVVIISVKSQSTAPFGLGGN